ncbi:MAG: response regulator transcription factor [Bacteroidia bacterium]|nr:response regulator transcription factor [Bacteroidia bacterium]
MNPEKKICLVDDHVIVRHGLKVLIEKLGPYVVAEEYDDGADFLENLNTNQLPDLVLMDLSMPKMGGLEVMKQLHAANLKVPVLILTLNENEDVIIQLFRLGARGYLTKTASSTSMKMALEEIFRNGYFHNEFMRLSLENNASAQAGEKSHPLLDKMSAREREFLKLVCHEKEYTYEQIADLMQVNPRTVDGYREGLFEKFSIKSKTGLVLLVLKHNLYGQL